MPAKLEDPAEILKKMGIDVDEAIRVDRRLSRSRRKDPHICICGHPISSHTEYSDPAHGIIEPVISCKPSKMQCHCKQIYPVLYSEDNRLFWRKTNSYGNEHALTRGITASIAAEKKCYWTEGPHMHCKDCQKKGKGDLIPALIQENVAGYPEGRLVTNYKLTKHKKDEDYVEIFLDILLCRKCLDKRVLGAK